MFLGALDVYVRFVCFMARVKYARMCFMARVKYARMCFMARVKCARVSVGTLFVVHARLAQIQSSRIQSVATCVCFIYQQGLC